MMTPRVPRMLRDSAGGSSASFSLPTLPVGGFHTTTGQSTPPDGQRFAEYCRRDVSTGINADLDVPVKDGAGLRGRSGGIFRRLFQADQIVDGMLRLRRRL